MFFLSCFSTFPWSNNPPRVWHETQKSRFQKGFSNSSSNDGFPKLTWNLLVSYSRGWLSASMFQGPRVFLVAKALAAMMEKNQSITTLLLASQIQKNCSTAWWHATQQPRFSWKIRGFVHVFVYYIYIWNIGKHLPKWCDSRMMFVVWWPFWWSFFVD